MSFRARSIQVVDRPWKPVTVHTDHAGKRYLTLTHPKRPGTVSFRASLTDTDGNTATENIHTAYRTVRQPRAVSARSTFRPSAVACTLRDAPAARR